MITPTLKLYPSAPLGNESHKFYGSTSNNDIEQQFEKKLNDVNSFNNSIIDNKKWLLTSI